jgi:hypothetical protein
MKETVDSVAKRRDIENEETYVLNVPRFFYIDYTTRYDPFLAILRASIGIIHIAVKIKPLNELFADDVADIKEK